MKLYDKVFYEFELGEITSIDGGRITGLRDGIFCYGGYDMKCFPYSPLTESISTAFNKLYCSLRDQKGTANLNIPEIKGKFIQLWIEAVENPSLCELYIAEAQEFKEDILKMLDGLKAATVKGVIVLRP